MRSLGILERNMSTFSVSLMIFWGTAVNTSSIFPPHIAVSFEVLVSSWGLTRRPQYFVYSFLIRTLQMSHNGFSIFFLLLFLCLRHAAPQVALSRLLFQNARLI